MPTYEHDHISSPRKRHAIHPPKNQMLHVCTCWNGACSRKQTSQLE